MAEAFMSLGGSKVIMHLNKAKFIPKDPLTHVDSQAEVGFVIFLKVACSTPLPRNCSCNISCCHQGDKATPYDSKATSSYFSEGNSVSFPERCSV